MNVTKISATVGGLLTAAMLAFSPASAGAQDAHPIVHHVVHHIVVHHVMENHPVAAAVAGRVNGAGMFADPRFPAGVQIMHDLSPYARHGGNGVIVPHPVLQHFVGGFAQNHPVVAGVAGRVYGANGMPGGVAVDLGHHPHPPYIPVVPVVPVQPIQPSHHVVAVTPSPVMQPVNTGRILTMSNMRCNPVTGLCQVPGVSW